MRYVIILLLVLSLAGCASTNKKDCGYNPSIGGRLSGQSSGFRIFGIYEAIRPTYSRAMANLYSKVERNIENKGYTVENVTKRDYKQNFILFSIDKKVVTGDVVIMD